MRNILMFNPMFKGGPSIQSAQIYPKKISPFYLLMEVLSKEKAPILSEYAVEQCKNKVGRHTFYVKMKEPRDDMSALFPPQKYKCVDRHLSIDKAYEPNMNSEQAFNFSIAHYTERYENNNGGDYCIAHVFMNYHAQDLDIRVKKYRADHVEEEGEEAKERAEEVKIDAEWRTRIKQNSTEFVVFLRKLSEERDRRLDELGTRATEIDLRAVDLSRSFPKSIEAYSREVKHFGEVIAQINQLNLDKVDLRDVRMREILEYAQALYSNKPLTSSVDDETLEEEASADDRSSSNEEPTHPKPKESSASLERARLRTEIRRLNESVATKPSDNLDTLIKKISQVEDLDENILKFHFCSSHPKDFGTQKKKTRGTDRKTKQEDTTLLAAAEKNITLLRENMDKMFEESVLKLDLYSIRKLFSLIIDKDIEHSADRRLRRLKIYEKFFQIAPDMLDGSNLTESDKTQPFVSIGNFLLKHCRLYKIALKGFVECKYTLLESDPRYKISKMSKFIFDKKFHTVSFFLEQGIDVNGMAIISTGRSIPLLSFCIYMGYTEIALELLQKGARVVSSVKRDTGFSNQTLKTSKKENKYQDMRKRLNKKNISTMVGRLPGMASSLASTKQTFRKMQSNSNQRHIAAFDKMFERIKFPSCLYVGCKQIIMGENIFNPVDPKDLMFDLIKFSDLSELVFCIASCANTSSTVIRSVEVRSIKKAGLYCCDSGEQADVFQAQGSDISNETFFGFIFFPLKSEALMPCEKQTFELLKVLVTTFQERLNSCSIQEVQKAWIKLFLWLQNPALLEQDDQYMKLNLYLGAAFFLLGSSDSFLSKNPELNESARYLKSIQGLKDLISDNFAGGVVNFSVTSQPKYPLCQYPIIPIILEFLTCCYRRVKDRITIPSPPTFLSSEDQVEKLLSTMSLSSSSPSSSSSSSTLSLLTTSSPLLALPPSLLTEQQQSSLTISSSLSRTSFSSSSTLSLPLQSTGVETGRLPETEKPPLLFSTNPSPSSGLGLSQSLSSSKPLRKKEKKKKKKKAIAVKNP